MKFVWWIRTTALSIVLGLGALSLQACGGGSSRVSGQEGVDTPTPIESALPTLTPAPDPIVVRDNESLNAVLNHAPPNSIIYVVAGTYPAISLTGEDHGPLTVIADEEGLLVQDAITGDATILGDGNVPAIDLQGQSNIRFEGFRLRGGRDASIRIFDSPGTDIRHCRISDSAGNGILVERTDDIILFNNLVYGNAGSGIQILDVNFVEIYNNTFYGNGRSGVSIGSSPQSGSAITLRNNIFRANQSFGISVGSGASNISSNYNLNNDGFRGIAAGSREIVGNTARENPLFVAPDQGDFHMSNGVTTSIGPAIDTGDLITPEDFLAELRVRTTEVSRVRDTATIDMGYHYPFAIIATPTANPTFTPTNPRGSGGGGGTPRTATPTPTPTRTPTASPTP